MNSKVESRACALLGKDLHHFYLVNLREALKELLYTGTDMQMRTQSVSQSGHHWDKNFITSLNRFFFCSIIVTINAGL